MSYWDTYQARIEAAGGSIGEAKRKRELRYLDQRMRDTLSYQKVTVVALNVKHPSLILITIMKRL